MSSQAEIGLIGLGVMGQNLALNIADHGYRVAVYNRTAARTEAFAASEEARRLPVAPCLALETWSAALRRPRAIVLMVQAGEATDRQIDALAPLLEPGDVIIDGGNARYQDTIRRERALRERGLLFLGTGVSGGEEGARHGPSIMAGGDARGLRAGARDVLEAIAAVVDGTPCCAHLGAGRRRPFRQDDPQRHRIRRHAADRRDLRPDEGRAWASTIRRCRRRSPSGTGASSIPT